MRGITNLGLQERSSFRQPHLFNIRRQDFRIMDYVMLATFHLEILKSFVRATTPLEHPQQDYRILKCARLLATHFSLGSRGTPPQDI